MDKIYENTIITEYNSGLSMSKIAKNHNTYTTTIKRILKRNNVKLRNEAIKKGSTIVQDGEKLIEWAKAQGRLVTKEELAKIIGTKRLSPSYFIKYPELGQYIKSSAQSDLEEYYQKLYKWLKENEIPYKPKDKKKLKVFVDALLLGEYSNIAIQISEKPKCISKKKYNESMQQKLIKAKDANISIIFLKKEDFENLDNLKMLLEELKKSTTNKNENKIDNRIVINTNEIKEKYELAKMYYFGIKGEQNYKKAFKLFTELIEKYNHNDSKFFLGEMYYLGYYVEKNKEKSFKLFIELSKRYDSQKDAWLKDYFFSDVMTFIITEYIVEQQCITEKDAKNYLHKYNEENIKIIQSVFKKSLKFVDFNIKIEILKYVQKYVKEFYNENNESQVVAEEILNEVLKYIPFYDFKYVKKVKRGCYVGDIEKSILKDEQVVKDLFMYPARQVKYGIKSKIALSDSMFFLRIIIQETIKSNKLYFADELMKLLYNCNQDLYSELYFSFIEDLKVKNKDLTEEQIKLLNKWKNYITNLETNSLVSKEKTIDLLDIFKTDVVKYEDEIIKYFNTMNSKEQFYQFIELVTSEGKDKGEEYSHSIFRIIFEKERLLVIDDKIAYNASIVNNLIDIATNPTEEDYYTIRVLLAIFHAYEENKDMANAVDFVKKLIDNKKQISHILIEEIILDMRRTIDQTYIDIVTEIINYAKLCDMNDFDELFEQHIKAYQIRNNEETNITNYILNINCDMSSAEIKACNIKIEKLVSQCYYKGKNIEEYIDFEKIIEYVIKNKEFFINKDYDNILDYVKWYFVGLEEIKSEDVLNSLIENQIIYEDISNAIKKLTDGGYTLKDDNGVETTILLRYYIVNILMKRHENQKIVTIITKFVNMIQDEKTKEQMIKIVDTVMNCFNDEYYNILGNIEQLNQNLRALENCLPFELYEQFLIRACRKDYNIVAKLMVKYNVVFDLKIIKIYEIYGIEMVKNLVNCNVDFRKKFLKDVGTKSKLIIAVKSNSEEDALQLLKLLFENSSEEKIYYELIKKLLFSINYRKVITLQELEYIKSIIITFKNEKNKKELLHKWELLYKNIKNY